MMKKLIALTLCATLLAVPSHFTSFADVGDSFIFDYGNSHIEIEQGELDEYKVNEIADILALTDPGDLVPIHDGDPDVTGEGSTDEIPDSSVVTERDPDDGAACAATDDTDPIPGDVAPGGSDDNHEPGKSPQTSPELCEGEHDLVTTTAYYTRHFAYADAPRCAVCTVAVTVCRSCSYIDVKLISSERVSWCHGASFVPGDANADGRLNSRDVVAVMKSIVHILPRTAFFDKFAADMYPDGAINARDVTRLMKAIVDS